MWEIIVVTGIPCNLVGLSFDISPLQINKRILVIGITVIKRQL